MGWIDKISGRNALDKMDTLSAEMERVSAALATRVMEVLERQKKLEAVHARVLQLEQTLQTQQSHLDQRLTDASRLLGSLRDQHRSLVSVQAPPTSASPTQATRPGASRWRSLGPAILMATAIIGVFVAMLAV